MKMNIKSESGQGLLEILLVIAIIAIVAIVVGNWLGVSASDLADTLDGCKQLANAC